MPATASGLISNIDFQEFVGSLVKALETKDTYTYGHSERVAQLAQRLAREMGFSEERVIVTHIAAHLHDLGKIGVPERILNKPGRLTNEEFRIIQQHSVQGYEILKRVTSFQFVAQIVKHHHERYDGAGYPDGLAGEKIPLESRIIGVADAFDAMTSVRSYRARLGIEEAIQELINHKGEQFDPKIVDQMKKIYRDDPDFLEELIHIMECDHYFLEVDHEHVYHSRKSS